MITVKLLKWLKKNAGTRSDPEFARLIGLSQSNVYRHRQKADSEGYDPKISKLAEIARKLRPNSPLSAVIAEVERESAPDRRTREERDVDAAYQLWLSLFEADPERAERVLANLAVQERLGITELVSSVVNAIVTQHDTARRIAAVNDLLLAEPDADRTKRFRQIAADYAESYPRGK